jgi:glycosyltransferase involved in cell wall biosynthesis
MNGSELKISLILPTIQTERKNLTRFLESVMIQSLPISELMIIDQNQDGRLSYLSQQCDHKLHIIHLYSSKGLSRGRNVGLQSMTGDIVSFPDDDCWYPPNLFYQVSTFLEANPKIDGICGRVLDQENRPALLKWSTQPIRVSKANVWKSAISVSVFLRRKVVDSIGLFDESLGLGAATPWQSGEETDYILRAIQHGFNIRYNPDIIVYHPNIISYDRQACEKALRYGRGAGRVLQKHHYSQWFFYYRSLWTIGGMCKAVLKRNVWRARLLVNSIQGEFQGFYSDPNR